MSEKFLNTSELPDDDALWLAVRFWGPANERLWSAQKNMAGHTIIDVGSARFIYDSLHKGLRAIVPGPEPLGVSLSEPFSSPSCELPLQ